MIPEPIQFAESILGSDEGKTLTWKKRFRKMKLNVKFIVLKIIGNIH